MKTKNMFSKIGIIILTAVMIFSMSSCGNPTSDSYLPPNTHNPPPRSATFRSESDNFSYILTLTMNENASRAVYPAQAGDRYELIIIEYPARNEKISRGTVQSAGASLTLKSTGAEATFTVTIANGNMTEISGTITITEGGSESVTAPGAVVKTSIGIAMPENHINRWVKDSNTLKEEAESLGYQVIQEYGEGDQNTQNNQIRTMMDNGARLIIVANLDTDIGPVVTEAKNRGVTIIAYDRLIQGSGDYNYYITFNNYKVGQMQGQAILDGLGPLSAASPKNIVLFAGASWDKNAEYFFSGAMSVLQPEITAGKLNVIDNKTNFADIEIGNWQPENDNARITSVFTSANTIHAVLAPNDYCARYIHDRIQETDTPIKNPIITGQDAEFNSALYIKQGKQYMTVFKDTRELAKAAITMADQILKGNPINITDAVLATGSLDEMGNTGVKKVTTYLLAPNVIKKSNLGDLIGIGWFDADQESQLQAP